MIDLFDLERPLSLYIHVPFCTSKCGYCAFFSVPLCDEDVVSRYVNRLVGEISDLSSRMKGRPFHTAFIGGGNPGCLSVDALKRICEAVCVNGRPSEFSIEMNPESLGTDHFHLFDRYLTRLSMGIQSLSEKALSFLGRNATIEQTFNGLEMSQRLRNETGCIVSYDLITCLGSWHDALSDVRTIVEKYPADHLSVYALTLEEGTPLFRKNPELPDGDGQYDILTEIWRFLAGKGYEHYEVSNFARGDGNRCAHNCVYWGYGQYIGLGPGAASTAFGKDGTVRRLSFPTDILSYAGGSFLDGFQTETLSVIEAVEELVLMGLRYRGGLDVSRLERDFKVDATELRRMPIDHYRMDGDFLVPDEEGLMVADAAAEKVVQIALASLTAK